MLKANIKSYKVKVNKSVLLISFIIFCGLNAKCQLNGDSAQTDHLIPI